MFSTIHNIFLCHRISFNILVLFFPSLLSPPLIGNGNGDESSLTNYKMKKKKRKKKENDLFVEIAPENKKSLFSFSFFCSKSTP